MSNGMAATSSADADRAVRDASSTRRPVGSSAMPSRHSSIGTAWREIRRRCSQSGSVQTGICAGGCNAGWSGPSGVAGLESSERWLAGRPRGSRCPAVVMAIRYRGVRDLAVRGLQSPYPVIPSCHGQCHAESRDRHAGRLRDHGPCPLLDFPGREWLPTSPMTKVTLKPFRPTVTTFQLV